MSWLKVICDTTAEDSENAFDRFLANGISGVEFEGSIYNISLDEKDWDYSPDQATGEQVKVIGYIHIENETMAEEKFNDFVARLGITGNFSYEVKREADWENEWKRFYKPVPVGEKLLVLPTWEKPEPDQIGRLTIDMDPGMAFGSGTHATTRMCMEFLEEIIKGQETVFDMGTGSGILAITAALLGAENLQAMDRDQVAVNVARDNIDRNGMLTKIQCLVGDSPVYFNGTADIFVANIIADVIIMIAQGVREKLNTGGIFIASGIILDRVAEVRQALLAAGFKIVEEKHEGEWVAIRSEN